MPNNNNSDPESNLSFNNGHSNLPIYMDHNGLINNFSTQSSRIEVNNMNLLNNQILNDNRVNFDESDNASVLSYDSSVFNNNGVQSFSQNNARSEQGVDKHYERRRKNNAAAKRSRDSRKKREDTMALRTTYLIKENQLLKDQLEKLRKELSDLYKLKESKNFTSI